MSTLVAVVPVREGSRGLPGKNTRVLAGVPLWRRAVEQGRSVGAQVIVTTDIESITDLPDEEGTTYLARPTELSRDDTPMAPVLIDALQRTNVGAARVVLLQATSPLRTSDDIRAAIDLHATGQFDLVKTVTRTDSGILKFGRMEEGRFKPVSDPAFCFSNRQSLPPVYRPNGAVYVFGADWYLENGGFETDRIGAVEMPPDRSFDIDTEADFLRAEAALRS